MSATTCGGCTVRWHQAGNRTGHCSQCHRTFSGVTTFDAHQHMGDGDVICLDPALILRKHKDGTTSLRFKTFVDSEGATVWRSAEDRPEGSWAS